MTRTTLRAESAQPDRSWSSDHDSRDGAFYSHESLRDSRQGAAFPDHDRVFGLDVLRATAILLVLLCHGLQLTLRSRFPWMEQIAVYCGFLGVELFFVLSGFLIGGILLRQFEREISFRSLRTFWIRRWFRTLPNYYLFLFVSLATALALGTPTDHFRRYLVFAQNLTTPHPAFFGAAWSLVVEEWFYLLLPLLVIAGRVLAGSTRRSFALIIGCGIIGITALRWRSVSLGIPSWDEGVRKVAMFRLDALLYGVLGAYVFRYFPNLWSQSKRIAALAGGGVFTAASVLFFSVNRDASDFAKIFLFSLVSIAVALLLPVLSAWRRETGAVARSITAVSLWSYSLYLCQAPAASFLATRSEMISEQPLLIQIGIMFVFFGVTIAISRYTYLSFERPMTRLRERFSRSDQRAKGS